MSMFDSVKFIDGLACFAYTDPIKGDSLWLTESEWIARTAVDTEFKSSRRGLEYYLGRTMFGQSLLELNESPRWLTIAGGIQALCQLVQGRWPNDRTYIIITAVDYGQGAVSKAACVQVIWSSKKQAWTCGHVFYENRWTTDVQEVWRPSRQDFFRALP